MAIFSKTLIEPMNLTTEPQYRCPLCDNALKATDKIYRCDNNHSFDLAKEHYLNLLPVQFKHSKNPGDNKAMVNARRAFLEQGYYQPLVDYIIRLYNKTNSDLALAEHQVLDAGCGEGYYTHQHKTDFNQVYGVDIAKEAIKKAGKKYRQCHFSVATLSKLPFKDSFFQWIYSIYAPILEHEYTRVLSDQGYLLTVTPAKKHLIELKEKIYTNAQEHDEDKQPIKDLTLIHQEHLSYTMVLKTGKDVLDLLSMTPFAFKADDKTRQHLAQLTDFSCQADFLIRLYKKA